MWNEVEILASKYRRENLGTLLDMLKIQAIGLKSRYQNKLKILLKLLVLLTNSNILESGNIMAVARTKMKSPRKKRYRQIENVY